TAVEASAVAFSIATDPSMWFWAAPSPRPDMVIAANRCWGLVVLPGSARSCSTMPGCELLSEESMASPSPRWPTTAGHKRSAPALGYRFDETIVCRFHQHADGGM